MLILFPGALGDFLCLWPTLQSLRAHLVGRLTVVARPEFAGLLPDEQFGLLSIDRREIADLFAEGSLAEETRSLFAGFDRVHCWTGFGNPTVARRLEMATGGSVSMHAFRGMRPGEHAVSYYARCVGLTPGDGRLIPSEDAVEWAARFRTDRFGHDRVLVVHPGSGSRRKNWEGMSEVGNWWPATGRGSVLTLLGPAENAYPIEQSSDGIVRSARLDYVAAMLADCTAYLGNDSGISHLAGLVGAPGVVLFGPTDPATWRPLGAGLRVLSAPEACVQCGPDRFCVHRLTVESVCSALASC